MERPTIKGATMMDGGSVNKNLAAGKFCVFNTIRVVDIECSHKLATIKSIRLSIGDVVPSRRSS
jgi:hypothetical protein